jgi:uncharacterized protein (TIGR03086 family)
MDILAFDQQALANANRIVAQVTEADLANATPCGDWDLRALLVHMAGNNNGWADAAEGKPADAEIWDGAGLTDDPLGAYRKAAARVEAAFAAGDVLDRQLEVLGYGSVSGPTAIGMHFIDYLVHGWDAAKAIGTEPRLDPELCTAVLRIGERWPRDAASIWGPDAPFGYRVAVPADAPPEARMLGFLGRSPSWPDPVGLDSE